jgi:cell division protein FtsQ
MKRRLLRRLLEATALLLLLAVTLAAGYGTGMLGSLWFEDRLLASTLFSLRNVRISGNQTLSEEVIIREAGLQLGKSLMATDLGKVRERLRGHVLIRDAAVIRRLPSEIIIEVEERVPAAVVRGDRDYLVDGEGVVMSASLEGRIRSLPCLSGLRMEEGRVAPGALHDLYAGMAVVRAALAVGFPPLEEVDCIDLESEDDAVLLPSGEGPVVHLGREDLLKRLTRWKQVAPDMASRWERLEYLDLRADGLVVAKPRETQAGSDASPGDET